MTTRRKILVGLLAVLAVPAAVVAAFFLGATPIAPGPLSPASAAALSTDSRKILLEADSLELYSVHPRLYANWGHLDHVKGPPFETCLACLNAGTGVLGKTTIAEARERRAVADGVLGAKALDMAAACYDPRHVLVATKGTEKLIVLMCFECLWVVFLDQADSHVRKFTFHGVDDLERRLNSILRANNIELDKRH